MYGITLAQADNGGYTIQDSHEPPERIKPKQRPPRQNAHLDNIYALQSIKPSSNKAPLNQVLHIPCAEN